MKCVALGCHPMDPGKANVPVRMGGSEPSTLGSLGTGVAVSCCITWCQTQLILTLPGAQ